MAPFKSLGDKLKGTFSTFTPTEPSARLTRTFGEVQAFKRQLVKAETGLKAHVKATNEMLALVDETITAFPRVWSKADDGVSAGLNEDDHLKPEPGKHRLASYPSNSFQRSLDTDLREEVYLPIERWHQKYREVKGRIGEAEATRLDYDRARQKLAEAHKAALKHASKSGSPVAGPESDVGLRQAEAQLAVSREEYVRIEEAVHVELAVLVMDAQNALEFVTRALTLEARALMDVASHHQQETVKTLPSLITESSGPLLLGPASPATSLPGSPGAPLLLAGGSPVNRSFKQTGSPLSTGGSPLGNTQGATGVPATPEQITSPVQTYEAAPVVGSLSTGPGPAGVPAGESRVVSETVREMPIAAQAPVTPPRQDVNEEMARPHEGANVAGGDRGEAGEPVDTPFGPATVDVNSFDQKRAAFLQEHAA